MTKTLETAAKGNPPVIWIHGASCTGCSVSLLNSVDPPIQEVLLDIIEMKFHPTIMAAAGNAALAELDKIAANHQGEFFLVVEGGIPTGAGGMYCTMGHRGSHTSIFDHSSTNNDEITFQEAVVSLGKRAKAVIAAGVCASNGGIPAGKPNPTQIVGVDQVVKETPIINIPNCPMHPGRFLGTLAYVLTYNDVPTLDEEKRPVMFYEKSVHDLCPRKPFFIERQFAKELGEAGCLLQLGCAGMAAMSDCAERKWNNGVNWCIEAGAPCIACSNPKFPDVTSPFYEKYVAYLKENEIEFLAQLQSAIRNGKPFGEVVRV